MSSQQIVQRVGGTSICRAKRDIVSFGMRHILFFTGTAVREKLVELPPNIFVTNFQR